MGRSILYVIGQLGIGGSERQLTMTVKFMKACGIQVDVAVWSYHPQDLYVERLNSLGVLVHPLGKRPIRKVEALRSLVRRLRPDLVHCFSFFLNATVHTACLGLPCVVMGSSRAELAREIVLLGKKRAILNATFPRAHVFNSRAALEQAQQVLPLPCPPKRWFVPNGLDLNRFKPEPWVPAPRPIILGVGSLIPVKRWERLILAAAILRDAGSSFHVKILGQGPLLEPLQNLIKCKSLSDWVTLAGTTSDVGSELAACLVAAHVSESEGSPNAVLEAMACGRAVVAHAAGETPYLVRTGETGILVREESAEALAEALGTLLLDPGLCERLGQAGRKAIEAGYSASASGNAMLQAYIEAGLPNP